MHKECFAARKGENLIKRVLYLRGKSIVLQQAEVILRSFLSEYVAFNAIASIIDISSNCVLQ